MGNMLLGGFDTVGDDEGGGMVLGRGASRVRRVQRVPTPRWMNAATSQGVSRPQEEMDALPFDPGVLDEEHPSGVFLLARPQRPFRGERLIMGAIDDQGNDVAFGVVIDPAIYVGAVQVGAAQGSMPIQAFGAGAFGVRMSWPAAGQGTDIKIFVRALAIGENQTITVTAVLIGRAMR